MVVIIGVDRGKLNNSTTIRNMVSKTEDEEEVEVIDRRKSLRLMRITHEN